MPHCLVPKSQGTPHQDRTPSSDHPCRWAHGLGGLHYLHSEGKWWAMPVLGSPWPQWGHLLRSSQDAHCGGSHSWLAKSHNFTKLDTCHGYWSIVLNQESSLLMTFNSPFGRYHFLWLPFGLVSSQDIFQKRMDQILEECQGCIRIADDITVHGHTEAECDAHLWNLMWIARKYDLVFNP